MAFHDHILSDTFATNVSDSFLEPFKHGVSSAFRLGSETIQAAFGYSPAFTYSGLGESDLDSFIDNQTAIALDSVLCNIGSDGCRAEDVSPGVVIASPDREDPPYFYTWTRDSGLVFKCLVELFVDNGDEGLQAHIHDYIAAQATLQGVSNPSGELWDGQGLGEPKFNVDLTPYLGDWGRPQRDGPPLRAIAMMAYARWLIDNGNSTTASGVLWPVIQNDLNYVAQYWNQTGFDLWEEVEGSSFFTSISQYKALVEGSALADALGYSCEGCEVISPHILCFVQTFWSSESYMFANVNDQSGRTSKDANTLLASIHSFDPSVGCDATTFQPCSDKALANHKAVIDSFLSLYSINNDISLPSAIAIGRYAEDVYYGGQPWYLTTLAAAEQLYDALYVWKKQGFIDVTATSLLFFRDRLDSVQTGTYDNSSLEYSQLNDAVAAYADGFVKVVAKYTPQDGSLAEQFHRDTGEPLSASDLTWSYAAFLTASRRRAAVVPDIWLGESTPTAIRFCEATSITGTYVTATATSFPGDDTHRDPPGKEPGTPRACQVVFRERVRTRYGQTIKVVGDEVALGSWDTEKAVPLGADGYSLLNPVWSAEVRLEPGRVVEYKYVKIHRDGSVEWEAGPNRSFAVPENCEGNVVLSDHWRS